MYSNKLDALSPGEEVKTIMFDVLPGKSLHVPEQTIGMQPTAGYDSHSSADLTEWYALWACSLVAS